MRRALAVQIGQEKWGALDVDPFGGTGEAGDVIGPADPREPAEAGRDPARAAVDVEDLALDELVAVPDRDPQVVVGDEVGVDGVDQPLVADRAADELGLALEQDHFAVR